MSARLSAAVQRTDWDHPPGRLPAQLNQISLSDEKKVADVPGQPGRRLSAARQTQLATSSSPVCS